MAVVGRLNNIKVIKRSVPSVSLQICQFSSGTTAKQWNMRRLVFTACGLAAGGASVILYALENSVKAAEYPIHAPHYPWNYHRLLGSHDAASVRRGFQVFRQVCSACHSLKWIPFRRLIDVGYTQKEMAEIAAEYQVEDGPNDDGDMFMRPAHLYDYFPSPYKNEEAAAKANNGAAPPDLSMISIGRHGEANYVFSLLTGFIEPENLPAGIAPGEGAYYNPFMEGQLLAMAPPLYNNIIQYDDGTPATRSQLAKDVANFLAWSASPENDKRKLLAIKFTFYFAIFISFAYYIERHKWGPLRFRTMVYNELKKQSK